MCVDQIPHKSVGVRVARVKVFANKLKVVQHRGRKSK